MFDFQASVKRRSIGLTPMIDVVFLLLVFFMLAARFGTDYQVPLSQGAAGSGSYSGPPRLVMLKRDGLSLNGIDVGVEQIAASLEALMEQESDIILLTTETGVSTQELITVLDHMRESGFSNVVLVGGKDAL